MRCSPRATAIAFAASSPRSWRYRHSASSLGSPASRATTSFRSPTKPGESLAKQKSRSAVDVYAPCHRLQPMGIEYLRLEALLRAPEHVEPAIRSPTGPCCVRRCPAVRMERRRDLTTTEPRAPSGFPSDARRRGAHRATGLAPSRRIDQIKATRSGISAGCNRRRKPLGNGRPSGDRFLDILRCGRRLQGPPWRSLNDLDYLAGRTGKLSPCRRNFCRYRTTRKQRWMAQMSSLIATTLDADGGGAVTSFP